MADGLRNFGKDITYKMELICSRHFSKAVSMSCETVKRLRRVVPRHPAFMRILNSQSFTTQRGQLFLAHHLVIWAL
jgi:hypothetical protein